MQIERLKELIEKCKRLLSDKTLSENDTKAKLIDPLLTEVLGWDEDNIRREASVETKESIKRPDYWYPKIPKVIVEAKKLGVDLSTSNYDDQVLEYAYNKAVNIAILTNFRWFKAWYIGSDGKISPFCDIELTSYSLDNIESQLKWFRNDNILNGGIEEEAKRRGIKTGQIDISSELTLSINLIREKLNNYLKREYKTKYSNDEYEELTQGIINRLIFIKKIEAELLEEKQLEPLIRRDKSNVYYNLKKIFEYYREEYDSDIFGKPEEKSEVENLEISDDVINDVLSTISHPVNSKLSYNFAAIDQDILGSMYENYLSYIQKGIKLSGGNAQRKAQGIYYTPKYIVDYIIENTLGEKLKTAKLNEVKKLKILDPACGSGSFLIAAVRVLDEYYTENYEDYENFSPKQKLEVIKNNVFGVDLDGKAIKIAELNIYLTVLTLSKSNSLSKGELLPVLRDNLKVGNSLIDDPKIVGDKAFKWEEQFPGIIKEGGFYIVIGNPPYVNIYLLSKNKKEIDYYQKIYFSAHKKFDLYVLFIERATKLLREGGYFSFIVPDKFLLQPYGEMIRKYITENCCIIKIVDLTNYKIFADATVDNIIIVLRKNKDKVKRDKNKIKIVRPTEDPKNKNIIEENILEIKQSMYSDDKQTLFRIDINPTKMKLKQKIETNSVLVKDICYVNWGARSGDIKNFVLKQKINDLCKPMLDGRDIDRYTINYDGKYLLYDIKKLYNPMFKELFENPKIIIRDVNAKGGIKATLDTENYYVEHTLSICLPFFELFGIKRRGLTLTKEQITESKRYDIRYILAIFNSKLMKFYFKTFIGSGLHVYPNNIRALPIKIISKNEQKEIVELVDKRLLLQKQLNKSLDKRTDTNAKLENEIMGIGNIIDSLVYKIYGITEEEKKIIEDSLKDN